MTAITRTPNNTNFLQPTKFILTFDRIPTVQYFCQNANIPGVSISGANFATPLRDIPIAGNKLEYNEFNIKFIINEDISSWIELYNWFRSIAAPTSLSDRTNQNTLQTKSLKIPEKQPNYYSSATLTIMSALNNPINKVSYYRMYPVSLSDINFDTTLSAETIITADATFRYEYFDITTA